MAVFMITVFMVVWSSFFTTSRALVKTPSNAWPNGIIYYNVAPELPGHMRRSVEYAIRYLNNVSCAQWVQRYPLDYHITDYVSFRFFYEESKDDPGCEATAGFGYGQQEINLGPVCLNSKNPSTRHSLVMHEMMHTMGIYHEHQRPNRDCYIMIIPYFVQTFASEYGKKDPAEYFSDWPYDFESIMHYPETSFLSAHDSRKKLGREDGKLSKYDEERLRYLYCEEPSYCNFYGNKQKCVEIERQERSNKYCKN